MSRRFSRGSGRAKRGFFWTGFQGTISVTNAANSVIDVYNPSISPLGDTKDLKHERTVVWMAVTTTSSAAIYQVSFALQHLQTDLSLATSNVLDPRSNDLDLFNKRQVMWGGAIFSAPNTVQPVTLYENIESKRRIDAAQEAIGLVLRSNNANTTSVSVWLRSLYSKRS